MNQQHGGSAAAAAVSTDVEAFRRRIETTLATVLAWDADPTLLAQCRAEIPWATLRGDDHDNSTDYYEDVVKEEEDVLLAPTHRFIQRVARYFQKHVMTWVHQPACDTCGGATTFQNTTTTTETTVEKSGENPPAAN